MLRQDVGQRMIHIHQSITQCESDVPKLCCIIFISLIFHPYPHPCQPCRLKSCKLTGGCPVLPREQTHPSFRESCFSRRCWQHHLKPAAHGLRGLLRTSFPQTNYRGGRSTMSTEVKSSTKKILWTFMDMFNPSVVNLST